LINEPEPSDDELDAQIKASAEKAQEGLVDLRTLARWPRRLLCAMGAFWADNPSAIVHSSLTDEVAAVND